MSNLGLLPRGLATALAFVALATASASASAAERLDRVQLHHNPERGVSYVPLGRSGAPAGNGALAIGPVLRIHLDGPASANVFSQVVPIDVDGNGRFEFLQYNGFRVMKVWDRSGRKLWQIDNPRGRVHDPQAAVHRDAVAVLDLDGDGRQDVAHCWAVRGRRALVLRRGGDGQVIRSVPISNNVQDECQIAAFRTETYAEPIILVADRMAGRSCRRNFIDTWARTLAFDSRGRKLWERDTCDAGHFAYPLDQDWDGRAEAIFVGRYLLSPSGGLRCTLARWPRGDHADAVLAADIDPARPGFEAAVVGRSGVALYDADSCRQIWRLPNRVIRNPQHMALARLERGSATPQIVVEERGSERGARTFLLGAAGRVLAVRGGRGDNTMPVQNANLDGAMGTDELIGSWGEVLGAGLRRRAGRDWFWRLRGSRVKETRRVPYAGSYGRWQAFPLIVDLDRDGRDEIVQWGQSLLVVGRAR